VKEGEKLVDFDTGRLRAFLHVAERGTVAAAAEALGYTAPAVSQQITKLEGQLGTRLFDRVGGRLRLSPSGERLLPIARQVLDLTSQAVLSIDQPPRHRHVIIAGFASVITARVVPLLRSAVAADTTFEVREAEDREALRDLGLGQIDIAIVQEYDGVALERSGRLTYTALLHDRLRLLAPPIYSRSVQLRELAQTAWLVNGAGTRCEHATQAVLHAAGIEPRITGRIADNQTLLALVAAGHGATIAPELVIAGASASADITVAKVDLGVGRTIFAVTRTAVSDQHDDIVGGLKRPTRARNVAPSN
jgi:DNA-binding transcriptional LysR family regulator